MRAIIAAVFLMLTMPVVAAAAPVKPGFGDHANNAAIQNRDPIATQMTPTEIAVGKRLAKEWKPINPVQRASITQSGAIFKFECYAAKSDVTRIVEVDSNSKQVRSWSKVSSKMTVGPFGPYSATITSEAITWYKKGEDSNTKYTLVRKTKTLNTEIFYNIMDEPWREIASC